MTTRLKSQLLARDAYPSWRRRVESAEISVRVVTPYFDAMLTRLLRNSSLAPSDLQVLTDLSPESGTLSYRRQLVATRTLIKNGIEVRSLPRVHAKVLICDGSAVTVGSQNFTTYARQSRETTTVPDLSLVDSAFLRTIDKWWAAAMVVEIEFIERLLQELDEAVKAADEANRVLVQQFDELLGAEQERLEEIEWRRSRPIHIDIGNALRSDRVAQGETHASLQYVDWYQSLAVFDEWSTLARWIVGTGPDARIVRLTPTLMYPILLNPSGRMGFARIAKTRITYVKTGGQWNSPGRFGSFAYRMSVDMPSTGLDDHNLRVSLTPGATIFGTGSIELRFRFVGDSATLTGSSVRGPDQLRFWTKQGLETRTIEELRQEITVPDMVDQVVHAAIKGGFTFDRLGRDDHNANRFFPRGLISVRLVEFDELPVLVASSEAID